MNDLATWLAENVMGLWGVNGSWVWADNTHLPMHKDYWDPLHNDAHALMVLDRMVELEWGYDQWGKSCDGTSGCKFTKGSMFGIAQAKRPEAICLAAKAAIEAERAQKPEPHECEGMPKDSVWRRDTEPGTWHLVYLVQKIYCPPRVHRNYYDGVRFCPFCGESL